MIHWFDLRPILTALAGVVPACVMACLSVVGLGMRQAWRRAAMFMALVLVAIGISVATKIAHYAWDVRYGLAVFRGASGHAARAAALYPGFAWIVFSGSSRRRCRIAITAGALVALAITIATIDKAMHTPLESIIGALVGAAVPIAMMRAGQLKPLPARQQALLVACAITLCAALPATDYDFEQRVVDFSNYLH
jgi:hypothetical protein